MNILTNDIIRKDLNKIFNKSKRIEKICYLSIFIAIVLLGIWIMYVFGVNKVTVIISSIFIIPGLYLAFAQLVKKDYRILSEENNWNCLEGICIDIISQEGTEIVFECDEMQISVNINNIGKYKPINLGQKAFIVIEDSILNEYSNQELSNIKVLNYYTTKEYGQYEDIGKKREIKQKQHIKDSDILIEIISILIIDIAIIGFAIFLFASAILMILVDPIEELERSLEAISVSFFLALIYKRRCKINYFKTIDTDKKYILIEKDTDSYILIKRQKKGIRVLREYSKNKYEYIGIKYKDNRNIF